MFPQLEMIQRLRVMCQADDHLIAATLYGSFTIGEADQYSDIECVLFFDTHYLATLDRKAWIAQIAPLHLFFADDFGHYTALFENLVRGEFHFESTADFDKVATWKGNAWFPSAGAAIMVDRTGQLAVAMRPLIGEPPERDRAETIDRILPNFINVMVFGLNTLQRGEFARSLEILGMVQRSLLFMARLVEFTTDHWPTPSKKLEQDLSPQSYTRYVKCTVGLDSSGLWTAYREAWIWGQELAQQLTTRHQLKFPAALCAQIGNHFFSENLP